MSTPSAISRRRAQLLISLILVIELLLLGAIAVHYQGSIYERLRPINVDFSPASIPLLDWPIWSQPAFNWIVLTVLAVLIGLLILGVHRQWLSRITVMAAIPLILLVAAALLPSGAMVQMSIDTSDQTAYQSAIAAYRAGDYVTAAAKFEQLYQTTQDESIRLEAVGYLSGVRYYQRDYAASVAAACDYARQATPSQHNWPANIITLHWAIYQLAQTAASLDDAIQSLDRIAACTGVAEASHYWLVISPGLYVAMSDASFHGDNDLNPTARVALPRLIERYPRETGADVALLALGEYDQLIQQHPDSSLLERAYYARAVRADTGKDLEQARIAYQAVVDHSDENSSSHWLAIQRVGHILEEQGKVSAALTYFLRINYPYGKKVDEHGLSEPYRDEIMYLLDVKMTADDVQRFISQQPDVPGQDLLRFSFAANLLAEDRYGEAKAVFQNLAQASPTETALQRLSDSNLDKIKVIQSALTSSASGAKLDLALYLMKNPPVFYNELWDYHRRHTTDTRGAPWSYYQQHNDQLRALVLLQQYMAQHPDEPRAEEALFEMGKVYAQLGSSNGFLPFDAPTGYDVQTLRQKAVATFNAFLQKYPHSKLFDEALAETGLVYIEQEPIEPQPAIQQFRALIQTYPTHHLANNALNWVAFLECQLGYGEMPGTAQWRKQYEQARADYQLILDKYPEGHVGRTAQQNLRTIQDVLEHPERKSNYGNHCVNNIP